MSGGQTVGASANYGGLKFEGFRNKTFTPETNGQAFVTQVDRVVNEPTNTSGYRGLTNDNQSWRWSGQIFLPVAGAYTFWIKSEGPQRLRVGGQSTIEDFTSPSLQEQSGTFVAAAPGWYDIVYEVVDDTGSSVALLMWASPDNASKRLIHAQESFQPGDAVASSRQILRPQAPSPGGAAAFTNDYSLSSTAGSYHDGAFTADPVDSPALDAGDPNSAFVNETSANGGRINLGFEGNTARASRSRTPLVQLMSFNGGEKVRKNAASLIRWRSVGAVGPVNIHFSADGGQTWTIVAANENNDGAYIWNPAIVTSQGRLRISSAADGLVVDVSDGNFVIGEPGNVYYVNDGSTAGDQYTTAIGSDANTGTTSADPMASLNALLALYDLGPGDIVYVDAGTYLLATNIRILAQDSGVTIQGPTNGSQALHNRGNPGDSRYGIEVLSAKDVTIRNLHLTGGNEGFHLIDADNITLVANVAFNNAVYGFYLESDIDKALLFGNTAFGTSTSEDVNQNTGFRLRGDRMTVEGNTAYRQGTQGGVAFDIDSAEQLILRNNLAYNGADGFNVSTTQADIYGNESRGNVDGFDIRDNDGSVLSTVHDNVSHDNGTYGFYIDGNLDVFGNTAYLNGTGYYVSSSFASSNLHDNRAYRNATGVFMKIGKAIHNRIYGNTGTGIAADAGSLDISSNYVYGNSIGIDITGANTYGTVISNNTVYDNANQGIYIHAAAANGATGIKILHNTIHHEVGTALKLENNAGNNFQVLNNIIVIRSGLGVEIIGNDVGMISNFNNIFPALPGANVGKYKTAAISATMAAWRTASGRDANSLSVEPNFIDVDGADNLLGWTQPDQLSAFADFGSDDNFGLRAGSPMIDAANGDVGVTTDAENLGRVDDLGTINTGFGTFKFYDIGAHEFLGSSADSVPPTLVSVSPLPQIDDQLSGARFSTIVLSFNEPLEPVSATSASFYSLKSPGPDGLFDTSDDITAVFSSIVYLPDQFQVRLNLPQQLAEGRWRFRITGTQASAIVDRSGNALDADGDNTPGGSFTRLFRLDLTAPTVANVTPSGETTTTSPVTSFTVTFAENIGLNATSVTNPANYVLLSSPDAIFGNGNDVDESGRIGSITYNPTNKTATITLTGGALPVGRYRLSVLPGIVDLAGNKLGNDSPHHATLTVIPADVAPPTVTASPAFDWTVKPHALKFTFSENVSASLSAADLVLVNNTTGQTIPTSDLSFSYDAQSNTGTWTFVGSGSIAPGVLRDGRYTATLLASGITDASGNQLDGNGDGTPGDNVVGKFFFLLADANHDAAVNFVDLVALAQNYNGIGKTWATGDSSYDGKVDFTDLVALAQRYNTVLPQAGAAVAVPGAPMPSVHETLAMVKAGVTPETAKPAPATRPAAPAPAPKASFSSAVIPVAGGTQALRDSVPGKVRIRYSAISSTNSGKPPVIFAPKTTVTKRTLKAAEIARNQDTVLGAMSKAKVFSTGKSAVKR
jgi:parallel beta-helix repeat protein